MRILFINKASLRHEGGAEVRTREVGKRLVSSGNEVVVLAAKTAIQDPPFELLDGMKLYHKKILPDWIIKRFPSPHYLSLAAANLLLMFHLFVFLRKERFDLIREDISPFPPSFLLALVRFHAPKRIAVIHNLPGTLKGWFRFYGPLYGAAGFLMDRMLRSGHLRYDRIVCAASFLAEELRHSPRIAAKVSYVPNGVNSDRFSKVVQKRSGRPLRLLAVGRLTEMKGHRYLIEALPYLKTDHPEIKLVILGEGSLKNSLIRLARQLGVEGHLEIRPPVSFEEMPRVYREFDFLVLPSLSEGFPIVLLEAAASGLAVVATDISGVREILDTRSATLCSKENAKELADKLRWAFEHPEEVARKVEAAYATVKRYHWDTVARQESE